MFEIGEMVEWIPDAPATWRFIHTSCPMRVRSWFDHPGGGACNIRPGRIYTVEVGPDSRYYDPDYRFISGNETSPMMVHEKWLQTAKG